MNTILRNLPGMVEIIRESLERSASYGVDAHLDGAPESSRLNRQELRQRIVDQWEFFCLAREQIHTLYRLLRGTGFCMALADRDGYVLHVIGDKPMREHFRRRRCLPGYRWTERDMGTCVIGLALEARVPLFLPGNMMYSAQAQKISNAGAPILSPDNGGVLGVISLSGWSDMMHIHTLGLVQQAASIVTARLRERRDARAMAIRNQYMIALLESDSRGIVTVDQQGNIVQSNGRARALLSLPEHCEGVPFESCLGGTLGTHSWLRRGRGFHAREVRVSCSGTGHFASLDPIRMEDGKVVGGLFTITEKKEMMRMAARVSGLHAHFTFDSIIGVSNALQAALHMARIAARSSAPVLLCGETGTGKELFAQAIHNAGERRHRPFVVINCGAIPKELLESELFGYEEGAFTGAQKGGRPGKFELADTGTLFLDEIGDMPFDMQVKLLRALQSGEVQRVGGARTVPVDLRIIAATNVELGQAIAANRFRADLYYRISTLSIQVPPLRERPEDIPVLARHFMERQEMQAGRGVRPLSADIVRRLQQHAWPGNIRQLENCIERAGHLAEGGELRQEHFGLGEPAVGPDSPLRVKTVDFLLSAAEHESDEQSLASLELHAVARMLERFQGNIRKAAAALGISRPTLYRKLKALELAKAGHVRPS